MIKICQSCGADFDVFTQGRATDYFVVCGTCWNIELQARKLAGVK